VVLVSAIEDRESAFAFARTLRQRDGSPAAVLLVVEPSQLGELEVREETFDDFIVAPISVEEVDARIDHLLFRTGKGKHRDVIVYGPLALNLETYQAVVGGRPLDLTFMEYELLRFLAAHPGNVFTREVLLSRVWGYEYFGGARTVDVHIRRLRAKLGEEHANLIDTVRSVGYRFGKARWAP
jgi:DNA-binding response OmpR family regulator